VHLKSALQTTGDVKQESLRVDVVNDTLRNVAFLSNLTSDSVYEVKVSAHVASAAYAGKIYRGPASTPRTVYVGKECDPHQAFSKVPSLQPLPTMPMGYNAGIIAGVICTTTGLVMAVLLLVLCR